MSLGWVGFWYVYGEGYQWGHIAKVSGFSLGEPEDEIFRSVIYRDFVRAWKLCIIDVSI